MKSLGKRDNGDVQIFIKNEQYSFSSDKPFQGIHHSIFGFCMILWSMDLSVIRIGSSNILAPCKKDDTHRECKTIPSMLLLESLHRVYDALNVQNVT